MRKAEACGSLSSKLAWSTKPFRLCLKNKNKNEKINLLIWIIRRGKTQA